MGACKPFSVLVGTDDQRHGILMGGVGRKVNREVRALSYKCTDAQALWGVPFLCLVRLRLWQKHNCHWLSQAAIPLEGQPCQVSWTIILYSSIILAL